MVASGDGQVVYDLDVLEDTLQDCCRAAGFDDRELHLAARLAR